MPTQPYAHAVSSTADFGASVGDLHSIVTQGRVNIPVLGAGTGWIDVRDVALAHILAAQKDDVGGQRIIISAGNCIPKDLSKRSNQST